MSDNFKIVNGAIGALVNPGISFTVPYPAGTDAHTFYEDGHILILNNQRVYTDPAQAGIAFGDTNITITNNTGTPWRNGDFYEIQLNSVPVDTHEGDLWVTRDLFIGGSRVLASGVVVATTQQTVDGTITDRASAPAGVKAAIDAQGIQPFAKLDLATSPETLAGIISTKATTPAGVKAALDAAAFSAGSYVLATQPQVDAGTSTNTVISPATNKVAASDLRLTNDVANASINLSVDGYGPLLWTRKAMYNSRTGLGTLTGLGNYLTVINFGDSVGGEPVQAFDEAYRAWGWGGHFMGNSPNPQAGYGSVDLAGGATAMSDQYGRFPTGLTVRLNGSGQTVAYTMGGQSPAYGTNPGLNVNTQNSLIRQVDTFKVFYSLSNADGTFTLETKNFNSQGDVWTDTGSLYAAGDGGTPNNCGVVTISVPRGTGNSIRAKSASGEVHIIGVLALDSQSNGLVIVPMARGGLDIATQSNLCPKAVMDTFLQTVKPALVTWSFKDSTTNLSTYMDAMLLQWSGWKPKDWSFVLPSPSQGTTLSADIAFREAYRDYLRPLGHHIYDLGTPIRSWDWAMQPENQIVVSSITRSGTTATVTATAHGYLTGDYVLVTGANESVFNVTPLSLITRTGANTFTYQVANSGATSATGTLRVARLNGIYQDVTHMTIFGSRNITQAYLQNIGILNNSFANLSRPVLAPSVSAWNDYRLGPEGQDESLVTRIIADRELQWRASRGIVVSGARFVNSVQLPSVGTGPVSLAYFFEWPSTASASGLPLLCSDPSNVNAADSWSMQVLNDTTFRMAIRNSAGTSSRARDFVPITGVIPKDKINCVVMTRSGATVDVFLNGIQCYCPSTSEGLPAFDWDKAIDSKWLIMGGTNYRFYGLGMYQSALTKSQAMQMHVTGEPVAGYTFWWDFNERQGSIIHDRAALYPGQTVNFNGSTVGSFATWLNPAASNVVDLINGNNLLARSNEVYVSREPASLSNFTLPTTAAVGDFFEVIGAGAGGWKIKQVAGHQIVEAAGGTIGTNATTVGTGGSLSSSARYNAVRLRCVVSDGVTPSYVWSVVSKNGTLTWV